MKVRARDLGKHVLGAEQDKTGGRNHVRGTRFYRRRRHLLAGARTWPQLRSRHGGRVGTGRYRNGAPGQPQGASGAQSRLIAVRRSVLLLVAVSLTATTVVVFMRTHDVVLISYWCVGALVIVGCLGMFVRGNSYTHLPLAP